MRYSIEQLENMPLNLLRNVDIQSKEEEELIQKIFNKRQLDNPVIDVDLNITSRMTDAIKTPEDEKKLQAEIDAKKAEARAKFTLPEEVSPETTGTPEVNLVTSEVAATAPKRFCEFCTAKGPIKHTKNCTRLLANK